MCESYHFEWFHAKMPLASHMIIDGLKGCISGLKRAEVIFWAYQSSQILSTFLFYLPTPYFNIIDDYSATELI